MTSSDIISLYSGGRLKGFTPDPAVDARFASHLSDVGGYADAGDACDDYYLTNTGKGALSLPFLAAQQLYPGCLPGGAQGRGSCVAWSTRNAAMVSYCASLVYGDNSERHAAPAVTSVACGNGVFATEGIYWFRRHGGDGWQCSAAAQVATEECGLLLRQPYPELGIDLTKYSASTEGRWGASLPPQEVRDVCVKNVCRDATVAKTWEQVRDLLANGYALSTCGSEAFVKTRDEYGVCRRNHGDTWYHAMALVGADDRPATHERYGCGLVLVQNSWGSYLAGPDDIKGTHHKVPIGSFWARWDDFKNRYCVALGPAKGWKARRLPDWGLGDVI